jgi:hypothetical protein
MRVRALSLAKAEDEGMDEDPLGGQKPSSIKPPMIKPPMAAPPTQYAAPPAASPQPSMSNQTPTAPESSNKVVIVINIILLAALIVGLAILAYRWFG